MQRKPERDCLHLLQMREAAQIARDIAFRRDRSDLNDDRMFQLALVKAVELIDESANRV